MDRLHPSFTFLRRIRNAGIALLCVIAGGTLGYSLLAARDQSLIDCLYMTFITITTIGYGEIIDLSGSPAGRLFTMAVALAGIGTLTYLLSNFTAFIVEGNLG